MGAEPAVIVSWIALGIGVVMVGLYVWLIIRIRRFMKDTGRGWQKRWRKCQEMFAKKAIGV